MVRIYKSTRSQILPAVIDYLEYALLLFVILETNTFFGHAAYANSNVGFTRQAVILCLLLVCSVLIFLFVHVRSLRPLRSGMPVLLLYYFIALLYFFVNVRPLAAAFSTEYILRFLLVCPLLILVLCYERSLGRPYVLWYHFSDITCIFSAFSLLVFFFYTLFPSCLQADTIQTFWHGPLRTQLNFYNTCVIDLSDYRSLFGLKVYRNNGFFPEPLMFCIPLITSLSTELFLRPDKIRMYRIFILVLAVLSAQSDLGLILLLGILGLKAMQMVPPRRRPVIYPLLAVFIIAGSLLLVYRKILQTGLQGSLYLHLMDFKIGWLAFLEHPFRGCGFWNDGLIKRFLSEELLARNPGMSNTIMTVLAEGGMLLSCLCLSPYVIGMLHFFKQGGRSVALWTTGAFGLYVGIIFNFRLYLMLVMAFGFSLLLPVGQSSGQQAQEVSGGSRRSLVRTLSVLSACGLVVLVRVPLFSTLYTFLNSYCFFLGQSVWKTLLFFFIVLTFLFTFLYLPKSQKPDAALHIVCLLLPTAVFFAVYPLLYGRIDAMLSLFGFRTEPAESILLLACYGVMLLFCFAALSMCKKSSQKAVLPAAAFCFSVLLFGVFFFSKSYSLLDYLVDTIPPEEEDVIQTITALPGSRIYAGKNAAAYHKQNPDIHLSAAGMRSFASRDDASILLPGGSDCEELFSAGYQVTKLSSHTLLYSNQSQVIDALSRAGYDFYRYYPYPVGYSLEQFSLRNNVEQADDGSLLLNGPDHSVSSGPLASFNSGQYTATWTLRLLSDKMFSADQPLCTLVICYNDGASVVHEEELTAAQFDGDHPLTIDIPFIVPSCEHVEFLTLASNGVQLALESVTVCKTPESITLTQYNNFGLPASQRFFTADGEPYATADGYFGIARQYDRFGRVSEQTYLSPDGIPTMIPAGFSGIRYVRNAKGDPVLITYYDDQREPVLLPAGFAEIEYGYDDAGCQALVRYLGIDSMPVLTDYGYAEIHRFYDENRLLIRDEYYDANGEAIQLSSGQAAVEYGYDHDGNRSVYRYYRVDGQPAYVSGGYAELHIIYNQKRQIIREEFFDETGKPTMRTEGYSALSIAYNEAGERTSVTYYDLEGNIVVP